MLKLTEKFNKISVRKGDTFRIELESNPTTGYSWDVQAPAGKASLVKEDFYMASSNACGLGGTAIFEFKAEESGMLVIDAAYKRPWEKKAPPVKICQFRINVI